MKKRLDILITDRGLAPSREKAKAIIMSGIVYVDGEKEDKAGALFEESVGIEVRGKTLPYVSRGGLKLEKACRPSPSPWKMRFAWMLVPLREDSPTACCKMALPGYLPLT